MAAGGQNRIGHAQAQCDAGVLGLAVGNRCQGGGQRGVEVALLRRVGQAQDAVGGGGHRGLSVGGAIDAELHQVGRRAFDGGQGVVLRQTDQGQVARGHRRVSHIQLDGPQRDVDPHQHRVGLHLHHAGERAGHALAVAGGVGHAQGDGVVACSEGDARQLEGPRATGRGAQALGCQCDGRARLGHATQHRDGSAGLADVAVQRVGGRDGEARPSWRLGVEREAQIDHRRAAVAGGVFGDQAQRVCAIAQRSAGQRIELGPGDGETPAGLDDGYQVGQAGGVAGGVQCDQQLGHADVVGHPAHDVGIAGDSVAAGPAGVGLQRGGERGGGEVGDGLSHQAQVGLAGVAGSIGRAEGEGVVAQVQRDVAQAEAAVGACGGTGEHSAAARSSQAERRAGFGHAQQGDGGLGGAFVAGGAGVAGRSQVEAGDHWCHGVGWHGAQPR